MARVLGIGGVFFKADDVAALREWYRKVLGFRIELWGGVVFPHPATGFTAWGPFREDSDYFDPSSRPFMINLIVDDLDGVLEMAGRAGVEPLARDEGHPNGRFAWLLDPSGAKVELWEPKA